MKEKRILLILIAIQLITITLSFETNDESISTCKKGPKYLLKYYKDGENVNFDHFINRDSVHPLIEKEKAGGGKKYDRQYLNRLGPYFTFVGVGGATFIAWVFLSICWCKPKCCYKADEGGPALKVIMFIIAIVFLFGIIACCISGYVYAERFKKNLFGSTCAIERLYYNIYDGQILNTTNPIWIGFSQIIQHIYQLNYLRDIFIVDGNYSLNRTEMDQSVEELKKIIPTEDIEKEINDNVNNNEKYYNNSLSIIYQLLNPESDSENKIENITTRLQNLKENFENFGDKIVEKYNDYRIFMKKFIYICFQTLYSFMLTFAVLEIIFLFGLVFDKDDLYYFLTFIFWFLIMLLSVTSFFIGACYGMINFGIKDGIGYLMYVFGKDNMDLETPIIISQYKDFINICLLEKNDKGNLSLYYELESTDTLSFRGIYKEINSLYNNITFNSNQAQLKTVQKLLEEEKNKKQEANESEEDKKEKEEEENEEEEEKKEKEEEKKEKEEKESINKIELLNTIQEEYSIYIQNITTMTETLHKKINKFFKTFLGGSKAASVTDNPFSFMNCSFIEDDLKVTYKALFDLSEKVKVLTALTLCIAFFTLISGISIQIAAMRYKGADNSDYYDEIDNKKESSIYKNNQNSDKSKNKNPQLTRLSELQEFN
jgi:hypothetical protein